MIIDIGSGPHPKPDADVRMDIHQWGNVNCLHNLMQVPYPLESEFFDKAYMGDVIEHIYIFEIDKVLKEVHRILKTGGVLEVAVPDVRWICERIVKGDWATMANVGWLNQSNDSWSNAMSYLFGGFHNINEYKLEGMGHVNGFDEISLTKLLNKNGFSDCKRVLDMRNPEPARDAVLKMIAIKK
jgi:predicted SAM-dependent methyltransferase